MRMTQYRQTKSGTWHIVYNDRTNCSRYKDANWKSDEVVNKSDLPMNAKICKKCLINNQ